MTYNPDQTMTITFWKATDHEIGEQVASADFDSDTGEFLDGPVTLPQGFYAYAYGNSEPEPHQRMNFPFGDVTLTSMG